jgi:hypothetical protein
MQLFLSYWILHNLYSWIIKKRKIVVHALKEYTKLLGVTAVIFSLGTARWWAVSIRLGYFAPISRGGGGVPGQLWTFWRTEILLLLSGFEPRTVQPFASSLCAYFCIYVLFRVVHYGPLALNNHSIIRKIIFRRRFCSIWDTSTFIREFFCGEACILC